MKTFIVFDLEWNQSPGGKEDSVEDFPFEIIEIGAVKLDGNLRMTGEFHRLIRPQVYKQMHYMISEVTHLNMEELKTRGEDFVTAMSAFMEWCGEDPVYCTWGSMDLTELQRNMVYYGMENLFPKPLFYYDVQKLYGLLCAQERKLSLDTAVEELGILEERPFHRAPDDAYYTGKILSGMDYEQFRPFFSMDYYRLPDSPEDEVSLVFPSYSKYVSRIFPNRESAIGDRTVAEMKCYLCNRTLRKKVRWFTPNQKIYYGLSICPVHGYLKGKIRIKKADGDKVYVIKTLKLIEAGDAGIILEKKEDVRKRRAKRNKVKRQKEREKSDT